MFRQKRGRPIGSKDKKPRKRKVINSRKNLIENKKIQEVMDITNCKNVEETQVDNVAHNIIFAYNAAHNISFMRKHILL